MAQPTSSAPAIAEFHPASRAWFEGKFGTPTPAQAEAWQHISAGRHTLIAAPTGSGKTLAAFYAAIDALLKRGQAQQLGEGVQIIYVSPLKALSNDIRKNLEEPLDGIAEQLHLQGHAPVDIRIAVRSGDTPPSERARMAKKPPHILVTTPESLYLLLTSASGRAMLASARSLIVDEIHALLGDKRGSHLALSMERLEYLVKNRGGETLQRIGLSATQKPIDLVARYLVGNREGAESACEIVDSGFRRELDLRIEVPNSPLSALMSNEVWDELYTRLVDLINSHETTLVFVNTRRLSERLALALAERLGDDVVCSHHGSMSKDHRHSAEQRLKAGKLKVLVATASMELGIDVGSVDLVVQFSSPKSIATYLQRVGRSGHSIHGTPKGILFPLTRDDLIEAAAMLRSIRQGELDAIVMPEKPLDILAQQIVAEVSAQVHDIGREPELNSDALANDTALGVCAEPQNPETQTSDSSTSEPHVSDGPLRYVAPMLETRAAAEKAAEKVEEKAEQEVAEELRDSTPVSVAPGQAGDASDQQNAASVFQPLDQALAAMRLRNGQSTPKDALAVPPATAEVREESLAQARASLGVKAKPKMQKYPRRSRQPMGQAESEEAAALLAQHRATSLTPDPVQLAETLTAKALGAEGSAAVKEQDATIESAEPAAGKQGQSNPNLETSAEHPASGMQDGQQIFSGNSLERNSEILASLASSENLENLEHLESSKKQDNQDNQDNQEKKREPREPRESREPRQARE